MNNPNIVLNLLESGIYQLIINRPRALNALNRETLIALQGAIAQVAADSSARALLVSGAGEKAFVAGADISEMQVMTAFEAQAFSNLGMQVMHDLEALPVPVIALVQGYALGGGCELAMACDWIIATPSAVLGQPEVSLGVPPGFGGTQRLLRAVGRARALELITTGRQVKAAEALAMGLVNQVVEGAELQATGLAQARSIAKQGPLAVRLAKQVIHQGQDMALAQACALETKAFAMCFASADQREGMAAFLARRPAQFSGE